MIKKIFDIDNDRVVITPECLLIPEFKALVDKYEDPTAALSFVYFMTHPESAYADVPENDKEDIVSKDVGGDFQLDDDEITAALKKSELLHTTPTRRFYLDAKIGLEKMGAFMRDQQIKSGIKDGNDTFFMGILKSLGTITKQFKDLEKEYNDEVSANIRGGHEASYDE